MDTYKATNTLNGKFYIGSSTNFECRKQQHLDGTENYPFQNALRKNPEAFEWEVWQDDSENRELEQALLDMWFGKEQCYNLNPSTKNPPSWEGKNHSDTTLQKMQMSAQKRWDNETEKRREEYSDRMKELNNARTEDKRKEINDKRIKTIRQNKTGFCDPNLQSILGSRAAAVNNVTQWYDPDHPELGLHNAGNLAQIQRKFGYPSAPGNRKKWKG